MRESSSATPATIQGNIDRVLYRSPDSPFVVLRVIDEDQGQVIAVGEMPEPVAGESVRLRGEWEVHARFGRRFRFTEYEVVREAGPAALAQYISETIHGIGPELAKRLVEHFGDDVTAALDEGEERLQEVPGIGPKKAAVLAEAWREHRQVHELMAALRSVGLSPALASRVYGAYGPQALEVVERQPYRLVRDIRGVGFVTADRIARRAGLPPSDPERIRAGLVHVLREAVEDGHMYLPSDELVQRAQSLLNVSGELVDEQLRQMVSEREIVAEGGPDGGYDCFLPALAACERQVGWLLRELTAASPIRAPDPAHAAAWLERFEAYADLQLSDQQRQAVRGTLDSTVSVITGGPGTGKTTVIRAITVVWTRAGLRVALAAPTGRAAKRMEELCGHTAFTIHRLLGYRPDGTFVHSPADPLPYELVVIDESSMLDMFLARALLRAIRPGSVIVFVGDANQLPPVGPGHLFKELVESGGVHTVRLTQVYRQAERSLIVTNAHRLLRGEPLFLPRPDNWRGQDMLWIDVQQAVGSGVGASQELDEARQHEQLVALDKVTRLVTRNLPRAGFAADDIQVLTPMRRGILGVQNLNTHLQRLLNPPRGGLAEVRRGQTVFRVGDRVMQTTNNYDKGVFNGELGTIADIGEEGRVAVEFAVGTVEYDPHELDQLDLAYALTVHKSQGSEYPAVVMVVHSSHYIMLRRNLLYTALTRAERMAVLVGDRKGLWKAMRTAPARERHTRLAARLAGQRPVEPPGAILDELG